MKVSTLLTHGSVMGVLMMSAICSRGVAQSTEEIILHHPAPSMDAPLVEEILYRQNNFDDRGFNRVITKVARPTLTVYHPAKPVHRGTAIVICPGGGYQYVVIDREGHLLARYFQQQGITAVVLKYRLPQPEVTGAGMPLPQQDALEAIRILRHRLTWQLSLLALPSVPMGMVTMKRTKSPRCAPKIQP
jgi:hypothetical protein